MWSDPPAIPDDWFCAGFCTDAGLERLNALLDNPANDTRPYAQGGQTHRGNDFFHSESLPM